jgi:Fur family transcriptional regulator, ferric uptake regulator
MEIRMTKKREVILKTLQSVTEAVSAAELSDKLPDIDLATIYRNLELFTQEGILKRIQLRGEALYEYQTKPHHHAVCMECEKMIHFNVEDDELRKLISISSFSIKDIELNVRGNCSKKHAG